MKRLFASLLLLLLLCGSAFGQTTWNPADKGSGITLSNGNLTATFSDVAYRSLRATVSKSSGQWQWEITVGATVYTDTFIGIATSAATLSGFIGSDNYGWSYQSKFPSGQKFWGGSGVTYGASYTTGDIIGVAWDATAGTLIFYKNGSPQGTAYSGISGITAFPAASNYNEVSNTFTANFGATNFAYPIGGYSGFDTPPVSKTNALFFAQ